MDRRQFLRWLVAATAPLAGAPRLRGPAEPEPERKTVAPAPTYGRLPADWCEVPHALTMGWQRDYLAEFPRPSDSIKEGDVVTVAYSLPGSSWWRRSGIVAEIRGDTVRVAWQGDYEQGKGWKWYG